MDEHSEDKPDIRGIGRSVEIAAVSLVILAIAILCIFAVLIVFASR